MEEKIVQNLSSGRMCGGSLKNPLLRGVWMAQTVKCQTLGFSSGHDVKGPGIEP